MNYRTLKASLTTNEDGTYTREGEAVTFSTGYQVSFENAKSATVSDKAFDEMATRITAILQTAPNIGVWKGTAEISWHIESLQIAEHLAKKFDQEAIWDWKKMEAIAMK